MWGVQSERVCSHCGSGDGRDQAQSCHICTGTGLICATSALGLSCHICSGTRLASHTPTLRLSSPLPHLHQDWARSGPHLHDDLVRPGHICIGTGLAAANGRSMDEWRATGFVRLATDRDRSERERARTHCANAFSVNAVLGCLSVRSCVRACVRASLVRRRSAHQ